MPYLTIEELNGHIATLNGYLEDESTPGEKRAVIYDGIIKQLEF